LDRADELGRIDEGVVGQRLFGDDGVLAGRALVVVRDAGVTVGLQVVELVGGEDVLPRVRHRAEQRPGQHHGDDVARTGPQRRQGAEGMGVQDLLLEALLGQPGRCGPQVLDLARCRDDVVAGRAAAGEVDLQRRVAGLAVRGGEDVEPARGVPVREEPVREQDRRGRRARLERARQRDATRGRDLNLGHGSTVGVPVPAGGGGRPASQGPGRAARPGRIPRGPAKGSGAMRQQQRLNAILDALGAEGHLSIDAIVRRFAVSAATARRDLDLLARQRLVTRTHGGAVAAGSAYELRLQYEIARHARAKVAIAGRAAQLGAPGEVGGLTGGTTTTQVARAVGADPRMSADRGHGVTVVTNALNIAYELAIRPHVKLVVTGGVARPQTFELVGPMAGATMAGLALDWAMI